MRHIDAEIDADADLRRGVEIRLNKMPNEQRLARQRERYLKTSTGIARRLDARGITEAKLQNDFERFKRRRRVPPTATEDDDLPLTAAWRKEIARRIRDIHDPIQYVIVSALSRRFLLYYNASGDMYPMNDIDHATLFKRLSVARAVMRALGNGHVLMKVRLRKDGSVKRLTSLRALVAEAEKKGRASRDRSRASSL